MLQKSYPYYLANRPVSADQTLAVTDKFTGEVATRVALADAAAIDRAIELAVQAAGPMRELAAYERQRVLQHCATRFDERAEELAMALCIEAGKPIQDARGEVGRLVDTFRIAAEESVRITGEVLPLDISPRARGYTGMWKRVPIGPCSFISPFNFPLNLAAHKVAPAIAAGCPFVLKPASLTPVGALIIGEVLAETDLPLGAFSILPVPREQADRFATDERLKLLSFTGSPAVGWALKAKAGRKKVVLELGGNAAVIVDRDADLADATQRIVFGAFYQSGQSCIGVQRILVHEDVYDDLRARLVTATAALRMGDPKDPENFIGPMITRGRGGAARGLDRGGAARGRQAPRRRQAQGRAARGDAARGRARAIRTSSAARPSGRSPCSRASAISTPRCAQVNDSAYGLQAGIFTRDLYKAQRAWNELEVGGVVIGDVPSWRVDHMPYGGVKESGLGREGVRFAIEEMTEIRLMIVRTPQ